MSAAQLARIRWAVRAALALGVAASVAGNVLHAEGGFISQVIAAWSPLALLLTIELIARVPVHRRGLAAARWMATAVIAGIAAWVSYWHMAAVASRFGESGASPFLIPFSVDGLIVVASVCLVELGGRIRAEQPTADAAGDDAEADSGIDSDPPSGGDSVSPPQGRPRKVQPSARLRVERAHRKTPDASNGELAKRLGLSTRTVQRWRPDGDRSQPEPAAVPGPRETAEVTS